MRSFFVFILALSLVFASVFVGCGSADDTASATQSGNFSVTQSNGTSVSSTESTSSEKVDVEPIDPPVVKRYITEIKTDGVGSAAVDEISKNELSLTPPTYTTTGKTVYNDLDDNSTLMTVTATTASEYQNYLNTLKNLGYTVVVADRAIIGTDNKASVNTNGKYLVSTNYIPSSDTAKITIDELKLDSVEKINKYLSAFDPHSLAKSNICEPLFISMGLSVSESKSVPGYFNTGLSYILRLTDGSFIVIDGGDNKTANDHSGRLMAILRHYAPDSNNIRIAAWIITHPHGDHARAINDFCGSFVNVNNAPVKIEKIIANIPNYSTAVASTSDGQYWLNRTLRDVFSLCKRKGGDVYKAHTGQVYNFCGLTMEILYTYDVTLPQKMVKGMDNSFSICFNLNFENTVFHINGDATAYNINAMNTMYGENLKCDVIQVPHHGGVQNFKSSNSPEKQAYNFEQLTKFYTDYTKPSYTIWPSTRVAKNYYLGLDVNENPNAILKDIMPFDNIYANGDNVKEFKFINGILSMTEYSYQQIGYSK